MTTLSTSLRLRPTRIGFLVSPTDMEAIRLWNIRQFYPYVLPVNLRWMTESRDYLAEFITANHRPLPGNPNGVMIQTTIQVGRSISEERARAAVEEAGLTGLTGGSWSFKFWYDHIWKGDRDNFMWRPRRARVSTKSNDLELTVSTEAGAPSVRFSTLSPDFASVYGDGHARWVNVLKFRSFGSFGTEETFALTLPSSFTGEGPLQLRLGSVTIVSREGFVLPQQYKDHREHLHLMTGRQAVIHWLGRNGVTAEPSEAGRIADQVLGALDGFWRVPLIADRPTLHLLDKMAKSVRKYADGTVEEFPDRTADVREWESLLAHRRGNGSFARELNLDPFVKANILKKEAKHVLMFGGEMEDHRPVACLTSHVNPHTIMQHPARRRMLHPFPPLVGQRRRMVVERLAEAVCHRGIPQHTHGHHPQQGHEALRRFQIP